jgi:8-oxo-dGTP diphosphatase
MTQPDDFVGAKLVLLIGDRLATLLRDERAGILYPGYWDLPGGGREGDESPEACVIRELHEELGLVLAPDELLWKRVYRSPDFPGRVSVFFAARLPATAEAEVRFGGEGQRWALMEPAAFVHHHRAVPHFRGRARDGLAALGVILA